MRLKVDVDIDKNRLYFTVPRKIIKTELDNFYTDLRFCIADLQPNFDVVGDFSQCDIMYLSSTSTFRNIMCYLVDKRIREKILIVKDNLLSNQLRNFISKQQIYEPIYVSTLKEAEESLSKNPRRNGLRIYLKNNIVEFSVYDVKERSRIIDISTSGCAMEPCRLQPSVGEEILMKILLKNRENFIDEFKIEAKVVREVSDMFAVEFIELDDDKKDHLWDCLLCETELCSFNN